MKTKNMKLSARITAVVVGFCYSLYTSPVFAQANTALTTVTTEVQKVYKAAIPVLYAVAGIVGIVGAIQVYSKWSQGDPNTTKLAAQWFGAAIFIALVAVILNAMFKL